VTTAQLVPLKYLVGINERSLGDDADPDAEVRYIDISTVGQGALVTEPQALRFGDAPSRARRLVAAGDTIVSTVRTYLRAVWPVDGETDDLVVSTGFAVLTPHEVEERYFSWWVRSDIFIEDVVARSVGVSYPAINALDLGSLPVRIPSVAEQRAIADYLDTETARIDALITKKRRMIELLDERFDAELTSVFDHLTQLYKVGPIAGLCSQVLDCVNKTAPTVDEETGFRMIRTSN
jgi:type I restriction enzyme S subunit